jgi:hypothetical protein
VQGAVRFLTQREKGGMIMPGNKDEKTGDTVASVLQSKHPEDVRGLWTLLCSQYMKTPWTLLISTSPKTPSKLLLDGSREVPGWVEQTPML